MWDYNYDNNVGMYGILVKVIDAIRLSCCWQIQCIKMPQGLLYEEEAAISWI
jgi:hypothetical protein